MATKTVEWSSVVKLACSECLPADVILCIRPELLLPFTIEGMQPFPVSTMEATLTHVVSSSGCDCDGLYKYTFEYDDINLVEGAELICSDINGAICDGCFSKYIEDQVVGVVIDLFM